MNALKRLVKIKRNGVILIGLFIVAVLFISSCAKTECETNADCISPKSCMSAKCKDNACVFTPQRNCCGNEIKEGIESGAPGSQCTCPADYGKCEGKGKIKIGSRLEDATYVRYHCNEDSQCILGVDKNSTAPQNFLDTINIGFFKTSSVIKYNKPFDVNEHSFSLTLTLDDVGKDLVLPVTFTKVKVLFNSVYTRAELLVAEQDLKAVLDGIGSQVTLNVPLNLNFRPEELEESGYLRYTIDYVYQRQFLSKRGSDEPEAIEETIRNTYTSPAKPVIFFRSS
mgnify:FL=1